MAAVRFVMLHPLCFLLNKFGKMQSKLLKSALVGFYSPEDLSSAKKQLLKDTGEIQMYLFHTYRSNSKVTTGPFLMLTICSRY